MLWKALTEQYESRIVTRATGLFQQVLGFQFDGDDVLNDLEKFEKLCKQYEAASEKKVGDDLKVGIVIRSLGHKQTDLGHHIIMNSERLDEYEKSQDGHPDHLQNPQVPQQRIGAHGHRSAQHREGQVPDLRENRPYERPVLVSRQARCRPRQRRRKE